LVICGGKIRRKSIEIFLKKKSKIARFSGFCGKSGKIFQTEAFATVLKLPVNLGGKFEIQKAAENSNKTAGNFVADKNRQKHNPLYR
jgi:hypothetical protein